MSFVAISAQDIVKSDIGVLVPNCVRFMATLRGSDLQVNEVFAEIAAGRKNAVEGDEADVSMVATERVIVKLTGLTYKYSRPLEAFTVVDFWENPEADEPDMEKTSELVFQDTLNSVSLSKSGPTTISAHKTILKKLLFPCGVPSCESTERFKISHLIPLLVDGAKRDCCYECFRRITESDMKT